MIVTDVVYREDRAVFLGMSALGPKARKIRRALGWHAEHDDRRAFVVVNQRPELTAGVSKWPFGHDVLARLCIALLKAT